MPEENQKKAKRPEFEEIDVGDEIVSWQAWEFPKHERGTLWYVIVGSIGVSLIVYAVISANYLFAIIILMIAVILIITGLRKPEIVQVYLTNLGVVFGEEFYPYQEIKDFSIAYNPPEVKLLYIDFHKVWRPLVSIPLEDADPNEVREVLLPYAFENLEREEEHLTDMMKRLYKL
ncbi:hypothetical protein KJ766_00385 [Patescibacteria group bacterium]|nr:hypothetical protein [Patescibacteria group bacterium]